ncbi:MAG: polysaccharide pyruvyl transferase family protein [Ruminococcaceae bacterium]|nr:polysaccharide pyruvyl transferase family protein [Oscillospiraceae bacterium]
MMKVAIVPLKYDEFNYGGVLQFYALQKTLRKLGFDIEILKVNDETKVCLPAESKAISISLKRKVLKVISPILRFCKVRKIERYVKDRKVKVEKFKNKYYSRTVDESETDISEYTAVVCGSDQIWNPKFARKRSFLGFVPKGVNKVIYAASLGCENMTEDQKVVFKPLVEKIDFVSVREFSAKLLLESFVDRNDIEVVLDPTLLLKDVEWNEITKPVEHSNYVLTYFLGEYGDFAKRVKDFAESNNLKIINIPYASGERIDSMNFGNVKIYDASPQEFISLIKNATVVFTDSFHACVFSSLFKRKFYIFKRKNGEEMMGRIETLIKNFNLPNRIIDITSEISLDQEIDYSGFEQLQDELIRKSINFLNMSVSNDKK